MKILVVVAVLQFYIPSATLGKTGCTIFVHGKFDKKSPVLLKNDSSLFVPENGKLKLDPGENITLLCPDAKNYLVGLNSNLSNAQCLHEQTLRIVNQNFSFEDIECKKIIKGSVLKTNKKCSGNQGSLYQIGYKHPKHFIPLIDSCYNSEIGAVLYTSHLLYGQDIKNASNTNYRPDFSTEGLGPDIAASIAYKQVFQKSTFSRLLDSSSLATKYINGKSYLARGHLSPDADFLYASWQYTSYYYINTVPQWQVINGGNWKKIESMIRRFAEKLHQTIKIFTGVYDILTLPNSGGEQVGIYLVSGNKLPVPKYAWKIVYLEKQKTAIVFVVLNNPFVENYETSLCENICGSAGWNADTWDDSERGLVQCCDYRKIKSLIRTVPRLDVRGVLYGVS